MKKKNLVVGIVLMLLVISLLSINVNADSSAARGGGSASVCNPAEYPVNGETGDDWIYGCTANPIQGKACNTKTRQLNTFPIPTTPDPQHPEYLRLLQACSGTSSAAASDLSNKCDATQFPINNIAGDSYAYGCVDAANAKSCKKSEGGIFKASFSIQDALRVDPQDQAYQRLAQLCVSGAASASGATTSSGPASCTNPQQCKEIDEVWQRIGPLVRKSSDVWDTRSMPFWKAFSILYPSLTGTSVVTASGPDAFDSIIREAAATTGTPPKVEFALIKAIMVAESDFKPNDISSTGCSGLLQICATSAKEEIQVQCPQVRSVGPRKCDPGTCEINVFGSAPIVPWCKVCTSGINCVDDDRFDPRKNIFSATKTIQRKMDVIPVGLCGLECQVAAYNIGEKVILAAIDAARAEIGSGPLIWDGPTDKDGVYDYITTQLMKDNGYEDSMTWNEAVREQKRANLKGYVAKIMKSYQSYKAGTS